MRKHCETPTEMVEWLESEFDRAKKAPPLDAPKAPTARRRRLVFFFLSASAIIIGVLWASVFVWDTAQRMDGGSFGIGFGCGVVAGFLFYHYDRKHW